MHTCPKCSGFLVPAPSPLHLLSDYFVDTYDLKDQRSAAVSCINCGYFADAVMAKNHSVNTQGGQYHASPITRRKINHSYPKRAA